MTIKRVWTVTPDDTALEVGSGTLAVLATPRLVAMVEQACGEFVAQQLSNDYTSVGTHVMINHLKATAVGGRVQIVARKDAAAPDYHFVFEVFDQDDQLIATGNHQRVKVEIDRFMKKVSKKQS